MLHTYTTAVHLHAGYHATATAASQNAKLVSLPVELILAARALSAQNVGTNFVPISDTSDRITILLFSTVVTGTGN